MNHGDKNKKALIGCLEDTKELIVFDTETTGLKKEDTIIQLSGIKVAVSEENGIFSYQVVERFNEYIKPEKPVSAKIEEITSITNEFLADKPSEDEVYPKIVEFFGDTPVISGYNVSFDIRMTEALYARHGATFTYKEKLDVLAYAKDLVSKQDLINVTGKDSFKQEALAKIYGLDDGVQFHLASEDALVTLRLLFLFANEYQAEEMNAVPKKHATVKRVAYKEGFQHERNGVYVANDVCLLFFAQKYKQWYPSKKADMPLFETIDLDLLEKDVLFLTGCKDLDELHKYRGDTSVKHVCGVKSAEQVKGINRWEKYGKKRIYMKVSGNDGKWYNCFYDLLEKCWNCSPFSSESVEKLVLKEKGAVSFQECLRTL